MTQSSRSSIIKSSSLLSCLMFSSAITLSLNTQQSVNAVVHFQDQNDGSVFAAYDMNESEIDPSSTYYINGNMLYTDSMMNAGIDMSNIEEEEQYIELDVDPSHQQQQQQPSSSSEFIINQMLGGLGGIGQTDIPQQVGSVAAVDPTLAAATTPFAGSLGNAQIGYIINQGGFGGKHGGPGGHGGPGDFGGHGGPGDFGGIAGGFGGHGGPGKKGQSGAQAIPILVIQQPAVAQEPAVVDPVQQQPIIVQTPKPQVIIKKVQQPVIQQQQQPIIEQAQPIVKQTQFTQNQPIQAQPIYGKQQQWSTTKPQYNFNQAAQATSFQPTPAFQKLTQQIQGV